MDTLLPTLKRGRDVWDPIHMPVSEFHQRLSRLRQGMENDGLDGLLLYGKGADEYGNPCYLSNFAIKMPRGALVAVPAEGPITLIVDGFPRDQPAVKTVTWVDDLRSCRDVAQEALEVLKEKNMTSGALGFAGLRRLMPNSQFQTLSKGLGQCRIIDADPLLQKLRAVKSEREQDQIRRSSRILSRAVDFITGSPLPGMNEKILEASVDYIARMEGAEDIRILLARPSQPQWTLRLARDQDIPEGERVILYAATAFERYWAEQVRTLEAGPSSFSNPLPDDARALCGRILEKAEPGKALSRFHAEALEEIGKAGMEFVPRYGMGGGIGLSPAEPPDLSGSAEDTLAEGMALTLRLNLKSRGAGDLMIGDTALVSKQGAEVL